MPTTKITKTNTGSFDQVFALSQGYLNQSLKTLWQNTPRAVGLHALQMKNIMGSIDAEIGPPEIVVDISPSDKYVLFNINTLSGKIKLRDSDSGEYIMGMPPAGFDLTGCTISFKVGISTETLDLKDPSHQGVLKQIHEDPSNYSLSRLYMDLTIADLTNFNGASSVLPDPITNSNSNWMIFFGTWMNQAHQAKVNTLGYSLTALDASHKPATIAPTFLPVFNQFQTCEWRSESDQKTAQGLKVGDNNCLLYLQITKGNHVPQDLHYNYTGNMINDGESGTLFISRKLFWDTWLLPQLTTLNYNTLLAATGAHCSNNEVSPDFQWYWKIGRDAANDAGRKDDQDPFYAFQPMAPNDGFGFSFAPGNTHAEDHGGIWGSELKAVLDCESRNTITFTPNGDTIHFGGWVHSYVQRWTTAGGSGSANITATWSFDIQMIQVTATSEADPNLVPGGLATKLNNISDVKVDVDASGSSWGTNSAPDGAASDISNAIKNTDLADIAKKIEAGISGLAHFILPGNGTFSMTKPTFNNDGDFLCRLDYLPPETGSTH